jgi:hypothetical protein
MKTKLLSLIATIALLTGCKTYTFDNLLADAHDVAWLGTSAAVIEAPESRDNLERAAAALAGLETSESPSVPAIVGALRAAGVKEINSERGQLYVLGGALILNRAGREFDLTEYKRVAQLAGALRRGIEAGLGTLGEAPRN